MGFDASTSTDDKLAKRCSAIKNALECKDDSETCAKQMGKGLLENFGPDLDKIIDKD